MGAIRAGLRHARRSDAGFATNADRVRNAAVVRAAVEHAFAQYATADLLAKLTEIGVPSGEVKDLQQVYEWDQTRSQGLLVDVEHATLGPISCPGRRCASSSRPATEWHREHTPPPLLGQHTDDVLQWLQAPSSPAG